MFSIQEDPPQVCLTTETEQSVGPTPSQFFSFVLSPISLWPCASSVICKVLNGNGIDFGPSGLHSVAVGLKRISVSIFFSKINIAFDVLFIYPSKRV